MVTLVFSGCALNTASSMLPTKREISRGQLIVHSDFHLPRQHRILDDLVARRDDISNRLGVPSSDEPIHVYLFSDAEKFAKFMKRNYPAFPNRRAFFVKNDTTLMVYAYWGERVAEDLRHEVTHGYLHSVVPSIPLWMDEGIAEFFETPRGSNGVNRSHVMLLANAFRESKWSPNLELLESLTSASEMSQLEYAESWLWIHFMLSEDAQTSSLLTNSLREYRQNGSADFLSVNLRSYLPNLESRLVQHLKKLAESN